MKREEIEQAIVNGDEIWLAVCTDWGPISVKADEQHCDVDDEFFHCPFITLPIGWVHKTKAEAEHYLHHANVSRTEHLSFLTWEEFKGGEEVIFKGRNGKGYALVCNKVLDEIDLFDTDGIMWGIIESWDLTEANFYKAYEECVRLFKGEE